MCVGHISLEIYDLFHFLQPSLVVLLNSLHIYICGGIFEEWALSGSFSPLCLPPNHR